MTNKCGVCEETIEVGRDKPCPVSGITIGNASIYSGDLVCWKCANGIIKAHLDKNKKPMTVSLSVRDEW